MLFRQIARFSLVIILDILSSKSEFSISIIIHNAFLMLQKCTLKAEKTEFWSNEKNNDSWIF
jgi:hypothetical protein